MLDISNPTRPLPVGRSAMLSGYLDRSVVQSGFLFSVQDELGLTVRSLATPLSMIVSFREEDTATTEMLVTIE